MPLIWKLPEWLAANTNVENAAGLRRLILNRTGVKFSLPTISALYNGEIASLKISTIQIIVDALQCNLYDFFNVSPDTSKAVLTSDLPRHPTESNAKKRAMEHWVAGEYEKAINHFSKHLDEYPEDTVSRMMLVECRFLSFKVEGALEDCQRILEITPKNARAHYLLGRAYLQNQRYGEAAAAFETSIRLEPGDDSEYKSARTNLALCYTGKGEHSRALRLLRKILKQHPDSVKANYTLILALEEAGESEDKINRHLSKLYNRSQTVYLQVNALKNNPKLSLRVE
jgi:tetratricopeptide (TPR) repeat protein